MNKADHTELVKAGQLDLVQQLAKVPKPSAVKLADVATEIRLNPDDTEIAFLWATGAVNTASQRSR